MRLLTASKLLTECPDDSQFSSSIILTGTLVEALNPVNLNSDDLKLDECQTLDSSDVH